MVQLRRAHAAMVKLNEFTRTELANEPLGDVSSSDSIFTGVFTLLSNVLTMPASTCMSFTNMETIVSFSCWSPLFLFFFPFFILLSSLFFFCSLLCCVRILFFFCLFYC